ncbi:type IV secretion protein Rhs [Escherichia coli]|nr:type IV secretion protein Rhs [Escherichia coli]
MVLTTQAQRAEEARQQAISGGTEPSAFPDTCRVTPNMAGTTASVCLPCG